jgi:Leucine-rich repeat (LRR) protein
VISNLTNLAELSLGSCQISDITAVSGLVNLTKLDLNNNELCGVSAISGLIIALAR